MLRRGPQINNMPSKSYVIALLKGTWEDRKQVKKLICIDSFIVSYSMQFIQFTERFFGQFRFFERTYKSLRFHTENKIPNIPY